MIRLAIPFVIAATTVAQAPPTIAPQPPPMSYVYCYSLSASMAGKAYISNIFTTDQSLVALAAEFNRYAKLQNYGIQFECKSDRSRSALADRFDETLADFDDRGFTVVQIQRK